MTGERGLPDSFAEIVLDRPVPVIIAEALVPCRILRLNPAAVSCSMRVNDCLLDYLEPEVIRNMPDPISFVILPSGHYRVRRFQDWFVLTAGADVTGLPGQGGLSDVEGDPLLQEIFLQIPGVLFQYRAYPDGRQWFTFLSEQVNRLFGFHPSELVGMHAVFRHLAGDRERYFRFSILRSARLMRPLLHDVEIRDGDGLLRWIQFRGTPRRMEDDSVIWTGIMLDITGQKRLALQQDEISEKYRNLVEASPEGIFLVLEGRIILANEAGGRLLGFAEGAELIGRRYSDFIPPEEHIRVWGVLSPFFEGALSSIPQLRTALLSRGTGRVHVDIVSSAFSLNGARVVQLQVRDISEERQLRIAMAESEMLYRSLFTRMKSAFAVLKTSAEGQTSLEGCAFLDVNPAFEALMGVQRETVINRRCLEVFPDMEAFWLRRFVEVDTSGEAIQFEEYDSRIARHLEVYAYSIRSGQVAVLYTDISYRRRVEEQIRRERDRAQAFLDNAGALLLALDNHCVVRMINKTCAGVIGVDEDAIIGVNWFDRHIPPSDREALRQGFLAWSVSGTDTAPRVEYPLLVVGGSVRMVAWRYDRILDVSTGEPLFLVSGEDVTDQRQYEQHLAMYRRIVSASRDMLAFVDTGGVLRAVNDSLLQLLQIPGTAAVDAPARAAFDPQFYQQRLVPGMEEAYAGGFFSLEDWGLYPGFPDRFFQLQLTAYRGADGVEGIVYVQRDLTERVLMEREVLEASQNERRLIGMELHDTLAHELLDLAIRAKLLANTLSGTLPERAAEADRLSADLTRSIEMTRELAHGLFPINLEQGDLATVLDGLVKKLKVQSDLRFTLSVSLREDVVSRSTATQLYFICSESLYNAVRHAKASAVCIELFEEQGMGHLVVRDDGTGLTGQHTEGIGLKIMRYRSRTFGGTLRLEGEAGGGTAVHCVFPLDGKTDGVLPREGTGPDSLSPKEEY